MHPSTRAHIAASLLSIILMGALLMPVIHEIGHAAAGHETTVPVPGERADGPMAGSEATDSSISCSLCTLLGGRVPYLLEEQATLASDPSSSPTYSATTSLLLSRSIEIERGRAPPALG
jgi:hypothetical protein